MKDDGAGRDRGSTDEANGMNTDHIDIEDIGTSDLGQDRDQERVIGEEGRTQDHVAGITAKSVKATVEKSSAGQIVMILMVQESSGGGAGHRKDEIATMIAGDDETVSESSFLLPLL